MTHNSYRYRLGNFSKRVSPMVGSAYPTAATVAALKLVASFREISLGRHRLGRYGVLGLLSAVTCLILGLAIAPPARAHWGDLATAEIVVEEMATRITLTYPTGLTAFADDDGSGQLSNDELTRHRDELTRRLEPAIALTDSRHQAPSTKAA